MDGRPATRQRPRSPTRSAPLSGPARRRRPRGSGRSARNLEATLRGSRGVSRWLLGGVAVLVLAMVGYVTWQSYDVARREINVFTARAAEALHDEQFDRAMRYALQAYPARGRLPWTTPFSTELEGKLAGGALSTRLHRLLKGHSRPVRARRSAATASGW